MRIAIDARLYGSAQRGLGRYVSELIANLASVDRVHEYAVVLRWDEQARFKPPSDRFQAVREDARWYTLAEQARMPRAFRRIRADLAHVPHFNVPWLMPRPYVVTIHDLLLMRHASPRATTLPGWMFGAKMAAYRRIVRRAAQRARHVIATSEFTKSEIVELLGIDPDRISVTYQAAANADRKQPGPTEVDRVLAGHGIARPYFLYVGSAYPHKNLETLLRAFARLRHEHPGARLVLAGALDRFMQGIRERAREHGVSDAVAFPGHVSERELDALYAGAQAFVFPSRYEGFGLPPLEAMARRTPVAAARSSCLPEVLGRAATYFDPDDPDAMAGAMAALLGDRELRERLVSLGAERVAGYSGQRLARQTVRIYERAHAR